MKLRIALAVLAVILVFGVLAGVKGSQIQAMIESSTAGGPPPEAVAVGPVREATWQSTLSSVGNVTAIEGVVVRAEVAGRVQKIGFEPGWRVAAGTVLVELDRSIEAANLNQAEADADLARRTLNRARDLFASGTIAEADLDGAESSVAEVEARVASLTATLNKRTIRAPFTGYLGIKEISVGQFVDPGDPIVSLQALDRVYVEVAVPQRHLGQLTRGMQVRATSDAYPEESFTGRLAAINPQIDADTRNLRAQAIFDNPQQRLRPGMFVDVEMILPQSREVLAIPASSVIYAPYGNTVFVIKDGQIAGNPMVEQRIVRLGETLGDFVEVTDGLEGGESVVTAGAFKLRNGQPVVISDLGTREPSESPNPAES